MSFSFFRRNKSNSVPVVLGIDGGGTKTHAVVSDVQGKVVYEAYGGPTNPASAGVTKAVELLQALLYQVLHSQPLPVVTVLGLAGIDTPEDVKRFYLATAQLRQQYNLKQFEIVNDAEIALANGATQDNAAILIAGTGSVCISASLQKRHRVGGMDYVLSDEGSGYWIGLRVLRHVTQALDGREDHSHIVDLVLKHFDVTTLDGLKNKVYDPLLTKTQVAEVALCWNEALEEGDVYAVRMLDAVVLELFKMVAAGARAQQWEDQPFDLVLAGSVATHSRVDSLLRARLTSKYPHISLIIPEKPPVYGAVKLALQKLQKSV